VVPGGEFYDYDDKYRNGAAQIVIPATLPAGVPEEMSRLAVATFRALRADVLARVDFFFEEGGRGLLVNELNALPGCTPVSMFPLLWEATGLPYAAMLDELVRLALERHRRRRLDRTSSP
jgi:D-alanine-D-alanine ligase